jgi:hypothetical protein
VTLRTAMAVLLSLLAAAHAGAQQFVGKWDLLEPGTQSPAIGKMVVSANGAIDFDGTIGSWRVVAGRLVATTYGDERLRAANMPIAEIEFQFNGSDRLAGSLRNLMNKQTTQMAARRADAPQTAQAAPSANGTDAKTCVHIEKISGDSRPHHRLTNKCGQKLGLIYCHEPSGMPGTKSTECGEGGRFYQQFTTLEPGQSTGNNYSAPGDARVRYGACFGGEGKIRQSTGGEYSCR